MKNKDELKKEIVRLSSRPSRFTRSEIQELVVAIHLKKLEYQYKHYRWYKFKTFSSNVCFGFLQRCEEFVSRFFWEWLP